MVAAHREMAERRRQATAVRGCPDRPKPHIRFAHRPHSTRRGHRRSALL